MSTRASGQEIEEIENQPRLNLTCNIYKRTKMTGTTRMTRITEDDYRDDMGN